MTEDRGPQDLTLIEQHKRNLGMETKRISMDKR
jgi:hypothetical protein